MRDVSAYSVRSVVVVPALHILPHPTRLYSQAQSDDGPAQVKQGDLLSGEHFPGPGSSVQPEQVNSDKTVKANRERDVLIQLPWRSLH